MGVFYDSLRIKEKNHMVFLVVETCDSDVKSSPIFRLFEIQLFAIFARICLVENNFEIRKVPPKTLILKMYRGQLFNLALIIAVQQFSDCNIHEATKHKIPVSLMGSLIFIAMFES